MATIEIPDSVKAAALITFGDTDKDGKYGVGACVYVDLPDWLDGKEGLEPIDFVNDRIPEIDDLPVEDAGQAIGKIMRMVEPAFAFAARLAG